MGHSKLERGWKTESWGFRKSCVRLLLIFSSPFLHVFGGKWEGSTFLFMEKDTETVSFNVGLRRFEGINSTCGVGSIGESL